MDIRESIVYGSSLKKVQRNRKKLYIFETINPRVQQEYEESGWEFDRAFSKRVRMKKSKPIDVLFEDQVWLTFAYLGFKFMNKDRNFLIPYTADEKLTKQIDVFAADDETVVIVECKATDVINKKGNFSETIDAFGGRKEGILKEIRKSFPEKKYKAKFIFATKNYIINNSDIERLKQFDILHFNEEIIQYYTDLSQHLGHSARFQLLGNLFEGQKIPEIENITPAIEGSMGGHKYYSFSIEPEKLLKIGYVLHRNNANKNLMPTYQRLIKRSRLKAIQSFVNHGGFFPNSIIINIDTNGNGLRFDLSSLQIAESLSRIGLLHLPQKYRSAFIIDGQHRLYGYAESKYLKKNSIPIIAFVDLKREEQIKLFMEINENQKTVSKNLRNTLNSNLLWSSSNNNDQRKALKSQIAQDLGENKTSPLFNKVIIGENKRTPSCCITIDTIISALNNSNFFSQFKNNAIISDGTFDKGNIEATYDALMPFLIQCFEYVRNGVPNEWSKGELYNGFLTINAGIHSLIRIFNDVIDHTITNSTFNPKSVKTSEIISEVCYYLDPLIAFFNTISIEQKDTLRKSYGVAGRTKYWRTLQKEISRFRPEFKPVGLEQYWADNAKTYNEESFKMIRDIEFHLRKDFKEKLQKKYGEKWFINGLPKSVYDAANKLASDKSYETGETVDPWNCMMIINYKEIAVYGSNWSDLFEKEYTKPGEEKLGGGKNAKTQWLIKLSKIRNQNFHTYSVTVDEYQFLKNLHNWLIYEKQAAVKKIS